MKKKTLYLIVIAIAATLLLFLGGTKVNASKVVETSPGNEVTVLDENEWDYTILGNNTVQLNKYKGNASKVYILNKIYLNNELLEVSKIEEGAFDYTTIGNKVNAVVFFSNCNIDIEQDAFKGMNQNKNFAIYVLQVIDSHDTSLTDEYFENNFAKEIFDLTGINCYNGIPFSNCVDFESKDFILIRAYSNDIEVIIPESFPTIFEGHEFIGTVKRVNGDQDIGKRPAFSFPNATSIKIPNTVEEIYEVYKIDQYAKNLKKIIMPDNVSYFENEYFLSEGSNVVISCNPKSLPLKYAIENNKKFELKTRVSIKSDKNIGYYIDTSKQEYTGKAIKKYLYIDYGWETEFSYPMYNLQEGKDFSVSYKNNKKIGIATITITGKGNFTGAITKTFKIVPKKVNLKSVKNSSKKAAKITWKKDTNVTGYEVYVSERVVDKEYMKTTASKLRIRKSASTDSKTLTIVSKGAKLRILKRNVKKENGYYWYKVAVEYPSEDIGETYVAYEGYVTTKYLDTVYKAKKYKKVKTIKKNKTTSYTVKKLTKGKTYYARVRSYKIVSGNKFYGSYSKAKTVKIKK